MMNTMRKWMFCGIAAVLAGCGDGGSGGGGTPTPTPVYTIGGTVAGLSSGASVTLLDNGGDALTVTANGVFTFKTSLASKAAYAVTVGTQPTGETCTVSAGSGTIASANVTNISVSCTATEAPTFSIGGTVSGFSSGASVVLLDNGGDALTVTANGAFTFKAALASKAAYAVTVGTQPTGETCTVSAGSGTVASANVTNVTVSCAPTAAPTFSIGGTVSGLSSGASVVLLDNGGDALTVTANGPFTFKTFLASKAAYAVTVGTQPAGETCTVSAGSGTVASANVISVAVSCTGASAALTTLYSFDVINGAGPTAPLIQGTDGNFYGTLENGPKPLSGFVFKISPSGQLLATIPAPANPTAPLVQASDGNFYGTTSPVLLADNQEAFATVFQLTPGGVVNTLYTFTTTPIEGPLTASAGLVQGSDGALYGTTQYGGANGNGSVYKITTAGVVTTLYSFQSGTGETAAGDNGDDPIAGLIVGSDGNFYGTTNNTIFKVTSAGTLTTLYTFTGVGTEFPGGGAGISALIQGRDGNFYGTTQTGGANNQGMIFSVTPAETFTMLYSFSGFGSQNLGHNPVAGLIQASDGNFYGTTQYGGANGEGSVYRITPTGAFTTLYSFGAVSITDVNTDGAQPTAGVVQGSDGALYGTTYVGGPSGAGTVFKLSVGLASLPAASEARRQK